jgi:hypothetical protein
MLDLGLEDAVKEFTYNKLRVAWQSFLRLIYMDDKKYFHCKDCSPDNPDDPPPVVVCDGTAVAFQRRMLPVSLDEAVYQEGSSILHG